MRENETNVPFFPWASHSHLSSTLGPVSGLTTINTKLLMRAESCSNLQLYKGWYLEDSLVLCPSSKVIVVRSLLGPMAFQPWVLGLVYRTQHELPPMEWALYPMRKRLVIPLPVLSSVRLFGDTSPPEASIVPVSTKKASQERGSFLSVSVWHLCPEAKVYDVFSNKVLLSSSGAPPNAMAVVCALWGSLVSLTNNLKGNNLHLAWDFCLIT